MQSNLYVHTKYENIEEIYLYPIWEFLRLLHPLSCSSFAFLRLNINNFLFISDTPFTYKSVPLLD